VENSVVCQLDRPQEVRPVKFSGLRRLRLSDNKLRVHTLSKELGVTSKAILEKCVSEGVEGVTNHMSTLSAGLAETIREWFSGGAHQTAVETAAPVDLTKVRARRRPPTHKKKEGEEGGAGETGVAVEEVPGEGEAELTEQPAEAPVAQPAEVSHAAPAAPTTVAPAETTPAPAPTEVPPAAPVTAAALAAEAPAAPAAASAPATPAPTTAAAAAAKAPEAAPAAPAAPAARAVRPAGPQNVPAPAQMKGPRVVGFAKPDPVVRPAPRGPMRPPLGPEQPDLPGGRRGPKGKVSDKEEEARRRRAAAANPRRGPGTVDLVGERLKEWNDRDLLERQERLQAASGRGIHARRAREKKSGPAPTVIAPRKTQAQITEPVIVHQLCAATGIGLNQLWPKLKGEHNLIITRNSVIPTDIAQMVLLDFGIELEIVRPKTELDKLVDEFAARPREHLEPRPPVVTMLGHVDHGKTSLLDAIRKTSVAEGEAGGITQHIGAYRVKRGNMSVTFLDTPGHEAFTALRARGANLTDVVVLVVAADDGVMPQTIEAVNHAKAAGVTIVIALNKIDLPGTDINKIYGQFAELELTPTEWGGNTDVIKTSAATGQGVEELVAHLATLTELLDLKADRTVPAMGTVIESQMHPGMGPLMRILVREGTLRNGDFVLCGPAYGRVRSIRDDRGQTLTEATPAMPVEVGGIDEVPGSGDTVYVVESLQRAKQIAEEVKQQRRLSALVKPTKARTLEDLFSQRESGTLPELNLIIRADAQGSVDGLLKTLHDLPDDQVKLNILHAGIGTVTESDVVLAEASRALVIGFNVSIEPGVQRRAEEGGVDIRLYRIIYDVTDDIRKALEGLLPRDRKEESRGKAEVREIFHVSRVGTIAGCIVADGVIGRSHFARVIRNGQIIVPTADDAKRGRDRSITSLKRFKDDAREVRAGVECGIRVQDFDDVKPGDVIEAYEVTETARKL
jgi:translation initiation factor IF-2